MRFIPTSARQIAAATLLIGLVVPITACDADPASQTPNNAPLRATSVATSGPHTVHYGGVDELRFGDTEEDLIRRGLVVKNMPSCGPRMAKSSGASPIFDSGRLVLVWADPPLHTPEGVSTGDNVTKVRAAYPSAENLTAPAGGYRFNGLLARSADRAYLFLHDGHTVQKLIVGYAEHAKKLFKKGFGRC